MPIKNLKQKNFNVWLYGEVSNDLYDKLTALGSWGEYCWVPSLAVIPNRVLLAC